jgi:hypothetical protein
MAKRHRTQHVALVLSAAAWLCASEHAQALLIDDFSTAQTTAVTQPAVTASNQVSGANIVGGERDVEVTRVSGAGLAMVASSGVMAYGHTVPSQGSGSIIYDGVDGDAALDPTGLGGIDFTDAGISTGISIELLLNDPAAFLLLAAYSDALNFSTATVALPGNIPPDPPTTLQIPFTDFATAGGSGADFASVGAFALWIDGSTLSALDVELNSIRTLHVAEPSTGALALTALMGIAWMGRRRRRA